MGTRGISGNGTDRLRKFLYVLVNFFKKISNFFTKKQIFYIDILVFLINSRIISAKNRFNFIFISVFIYFFDERVWGVGGEVGCRLNSFHKEVTGSTNKFHMGKKSKVMLCKIF